MKKLLPLLLLLFFASRIIAQDHSIDNLKTDKAKLDTLAKHTRRLLLMRDFEHAVQTAKQGIAMAKHLGADSSVAIFNILLAKKITGREEGDSLLNYARIGYYYAVKAKKPYLQVSALSMKNSLLASMGRLDSSYVTLKKMDSLAEGLHMAKVNIAIQEGFSLYYENRGDYDAALDACYKGLKYCAAAKDSVGMMVLNNSISNIYGHLKDYGRSAEYNKLLLKGLRAPGLGHSSFVYRELAQNYVKLNKPDSAEYYYNLILKGAKAANDHQQQMVTLGNIADFYQSFKKNAKAETALLDAMKLGEDNKLGLLLSGAELSLAKLYVEDVKYPQAKQVLDKLLPLAKKLKAKETLDAAFELQAKVEAAAQDYNKAIADEKQHTVYHDSVVNATSVKAIAEMEAKYQTEKKQQQITLLAQKARAQSLELAVQQRNKYFLIAGLVFVLVITGLVVYGYRLKQNSNILLAGKNQELENKNLALKQLNEQLDEANRSKTKLFSILSHDLRAPVGSLFQFLTLQKNGVKQLKSEDKQRHNERIINSAENLMESMEDLLIWSKSQMDTFSLQIETAAAGEIIDDVIALHEDFAASRNIRLVKQDIGYILVKSDLNFLKVVLRNITSNGIKFTPAGGSISFSAEQTSDKILFKIRDTGIGMSAAQINVLFEWNSIRSDTSGMGLRLAKEFTERLGGSIEVTSVVGEGTMFVVAVPV